MYIFGVFVWCAYNFVFSFYVLCFYLFVLQANHYVSRRLPYCVIQALGLVVMQMIAIIIYVYCTFLCSIYNFVNAVIFRLDLLLLIPLGILIMLACKVCLLMFLSALAFVRGFSQRFMCQKGCLGDFSTGRKLSLLLVQFVLLDLLLVCPTSSLFLIGSMILLSLWFLMRLMSG